MVEIERLLESFNFAHGECYSLKCEKTFLSVRDKIFRNVAMNKIEEYVDFIHHRHFQSSLHGTANTGFSASTTKGMYLQVLFYVQHSLRFSFSFLYCVKNIRLFNLVFIFGNRKSRKEPSRASTLNEEQRQRVFCQKLLYDESGM